MVNVSVNYWAVLVGALIHMVAGMLWYGPLFGKKWMSLMGFPMEKMEEMKKKGGMGGSYTLAFLGALVMSYVLAHFVVYAGATSFDGGMQAAFWIWLGFLATTGMSSFLWEGKPKALYVLNMSYELVSLLLMGGVLAVWK